MELGTEHAERKRAAMEEAVVIFRNPIPPLFWVRCSGGFFEHVEPLVDIIILFSLSEPLR
jgi:hypothetical protein